MAYTIIKTNGTTLVSLADGSVDTTACSLTLIGRNVSTYGERVNDNFVRLLENAANGTAPTNPLSGQLWFNTSQNQLNCYNGTAWNSLATYNKNSSAPSGLSDGDLWYDTTAQKLKVRISSADQVIGPLGNLTISGDVTGTAAVGGSANLSVAVTLAQDRVRISGDTVTGQLNAAAGFVAGSGTTANLVYAVGSNVGIKNNSPQLALDVAGSVRMVPVTETAHSGNISIDASNANHLITLTGSAVLTFANFIYPGQLLRLVINGTNNNITWPTDIYWPNGAVPNLAHGPQKIAVVTLFRPASGAALATYVSY
jgi:hypothetical protein